MTDDLVNWDGVVAVSDAGRWRQPWRLPPDRLAAAFSPELAEHAAVATGVRLGLVTDAAEVTLPVHSTPIWQPRPRFVDVFVDGRLTQRVPVGSGAEDVVVALPGTRSRVELWLPHRGAVTRVGAPSASAGATVEPWESDGPRWITYGSSLTQCLITEAPSDTWPARIARTHGWRMLNLGFAAQAYLDPFVARAIAARPADLISVELGPNLYIRGPFTTRSLGGLAAGFLETIRAAHPDVPVVAFSPPVWVQRENEPNPHGLTLRDVRALVEDVVAVLQRLGDDNLHLVSGAELFGAGDAALTVDGLHPDAAGDALIAERFGPRLAAALAAAAPVRS
ncbi:MULTISPECIES: SGNH/GDSL hydrolase family protein [Nocardia]|uniref:SGNH/GDSL hydrolase family protein n=1 Tax=Nocardia TaxID=1817 RepID=UPI0003122A33|nr:MULTISPECIES: SGNH/GDSL hydrolase family protein [Nocardia]